MDLSTKTSISVTPMKDPLAFQSKVHGISKISENSNPNTSYSSPGAKHTNSPMIKSAKSQKSASKNPIINHNAVPYSPRNKIRERKFVVAKKNSKKEKVNSTSTVDCKCKERFGGNVNKCLCVAYETLRASQEEFFKKRDSTGEKDELDKEKNPKVPEIQTNSSFSLPEFQHSKMPESQDSPSSLCPSDLFLTSENLGLDPSISSRTSNGGRRSRRNSSESCGTMGGSRWKKKQLKTTCQKPFKLRTEQRGRKKEEEFMKKLQEMMAEEEKQRILLHKVSLGQQMNQSKREHQAIDLKLHSDIRAVSELSLTSRWQKRKNKQIEEGACSKSTTYALFRPALHSQKTGRLKELAPYDPDWYYVRAASMARKIYLRGGLGVGAFRRIYGGSKRNGSRPPHFCKSSGAIARHILQQLQNMNIVDIDPKGGRRITSSGQRDLDQVAGRIVIAP
ncbi:hypothetical protein GH714_012520 [Hevea brasiliensis]|uniref:Uncharacterized protein n=1 Tax=Hevea brasiliensis TaxID=3981 RepID=A0A6A6MMQ7_HEVBR|nr:hypothetical protein GH714_012520 [Hevea brasiliensis]